MSHISAAKLLQSLRLFVTLWIIAYQALFLIECCPRDSSGKNTGVGYHAILGNWCTSEIQGARKLTRQWGEAGWLWKLFNELKENGPCLFQCKCRVISGCSVFEDKPCCWQDTHCPQESLALSWVYTLTFWWGLVGGRGLFNVSVWERIQNTLCFWRGKFLRRKFLFRRRSPQGFYSTQKPVLCMIWRVNRDSAHTE